jgi:galactonate dehydratase
MLITELRTLRLDEFPNLLWVDVITDEGVCGLGETFFGPAAVSSYIHESVAPYLLGEDPLAVERHSHELYGYYLRYGGLGAETRGASAIDMALWDILGKSLGVPLYQLLGGRFRDCIPAYNTCAGPGYARKPIVGPIDNREWANVGSGVGAYEDLDAFLNRPEQLAESLVAEGFGAMKIWPFDALATRSAGQTLTADELARGCEPVRRIRESVGDAIEVALEFHCRWGLTAAKQIARALEEYDPLWFEDPIRIDSVAELVQFAQSTRVPTSASELIGGHRGFRALLEEHCFGYVMVDPCWVGGITEAKRVATMANAYHLPLTMHDCLGPLLLTVGVHFGVSAPNATWQEMVRAFYAGWYQDLVTELPRLDQGSLWPTEGAGLGTSLIPDVWERADAHVRTSRLD